MRVSWQRFDSTALNGVVLLHARLRPARCSMADDHEATEYRTDATAALRYAVLLLDTDSMSWFTVTVACYVAVQGRPRGRQTKYTQATALLATCPCRLPMRFHVGLHRVAAVPAAWSLPPG